ncbi:MAG: hypothetical protein LBR34_12095 [Prevotella sp.]|jgi:hypothetical protein|nr:hypothetical protein [Prevotella sp.]
MKKMKFLCLASIALAVFTFVSCDDDYGTEDFTGEYDYTERYVFWKIFQGDTLRRPSDQINGILDISGFSGKIKATFKPDGTPVGSLYETYDYTISGKTILGDSYLGEITFPFGTYPGINVTNEGELDGKYLSILITYSGTYTEGSNVGHIKGERRIEAVKRK